LEPNGIAAACFQSEGFGVEGVMINSLEVNVSGESRNAEVALSRVSIF